MAAVSNLVNFLFIEVKEHMAPLLLLIFWYTGVCLLFVETWFRVILYKLELVVGQHHELVQLVIFLFEMHSPAFNYSLLRGRRVLRNPSFSFAKCIGFFVNKDSAHMYPLPYTKGAASRL